VAKYKVSLLRKSIEGEAIRSPSEMLKAHRTSAGDPKAGPPERLAAPGIGEASSYSKATAKDLLSERAKLLGSPGEES
jgi:hypothetical protein